MEMLQKFRLQSLSFGTVTTFNQIFHITQKNYVKSLEISL